MQGLRLFAGNLLENLAKKLADNLHEPLSSPFEKEIIVVQSKGMEHWLSMQLAERHGICSNCSFPFPNTMMDYLFRLVLPDMPEESLFDRGFMSWRIMSLLPGLVENAGFESMRSYLLDDPKGMKLYQLSDCLADIYDSLCRVPARDDDGLAGRQPFHARFRRPARGLAVAALESPFAGPCP